VLLARRQGAPVVHPARLSEEEPFHREQRALQGPTWAAQLAVLQKVLDVLPPFAGAPDDSSAVELKDSAPRQPSEPRDAAARADSMVSLSAQAAALAPARSDQSLLPWAAPQSPTRVPGAEEMRRRLVATPQASARATQREVCRTTIHLAPVAPRSSARKHEAIGIHPRSSCRTQS
jgi:hypothetical protein